MVIVLQLVFHVNITYHEEYTQTLYKLQQTAHAAYVF